MNFLKKLFIFGLLLVIPSTGYCAIKAAVASGTFSTMTWYSVSNTPTIHASTNVNISASANTTLSATYTAPNTTNNSVGVFVHITEVGTAGTITFNLQEYDGVSAWTTRASQTRTVASLSGYCPRYDVTNWIFLRWTTPYTYTTTSSGYYRINAQISGASGTTSLAANSGGSLIAFVEVNDTSAGLAVSGDNIWIGGDISDAAKVTVTMDGTQVVGARTSTSTSTRNVGNAISICDNGILSYSITANTSLTCRGNLMVYKNGAYRQGTLANPVPSSYTSTLTFSQASAEAHTIKCSIGSEFNVYGTKTTHKTTWTSGVGSAGDPMVLADDVNWAVGDVVCISGKTYNQYETTTISSVNVGTPDTYVLTTPITAANHTAGGVEIVLSTNHNCTITSDNSTYDWKYDISYFDTSSTLYNIVGCKIFYSGNGTFYTLNLDNVSFYGSLNGILYTSTSAVPLTINDCCFLAVSGATNSVSFNFGNAANDFLAATISNIYAIGNQGDGVFFRLTNGTVSNIIVRNCQKSGSSVSGGINFGQCINTTFTGLAVDGCNSRGTFIYGSQILVSVINSTFGTVYTNTEDIGLTTANIFVDSTYKNCNFGSATLVDPNYTYMLPGSKLKFDKYLTTANNHRWYNPYGILIATGYGLSDTTVWTGTAFAAASSGQFGLSFYPNSGTNTLVYEDNGGSTLVGNCQNLTLTVTARIKINNAAYYAGTKTLPTLRVTYDDGATTVTDVADASTDAQQLQVVFTPTTTTQFIKIEILGATDAASPNNKFYLGELVVAGPSGVVIDTTRFSGITSAWSNGLPLGTFRTFLAPANMWDEPSSIHNITDSFGELVVRIKNICKRLEALVGAGI